MVPEPVAHDLPGLRLVVPAQVASAWSAMVQPRRCDSDPPSWLRPGQHDPWRRAVAAVEGWSGAILAEPVGSGKSWIALAVAQRWTSSPTIMGPASLAAQWQHTVQRAGMTHHWLSHERLSRGMVPVHATDFVIVDEAHRFRHLDTRRSRTLAPWLAGRQVLFLTATPIINRRTDLLSLLRLLVADDALHLDGIPSIRALAEHRDPPSALSRLVIRSSDGTPVHPIRRVELAVHATERRRGREAVAAVHSLTLGHEKGVRALVATVLLDAAASSDAAWRSALHRYRALLRQSQDAGGLSRAALRQFAGPELDQLVLWPLLDVRDSHGAPPLCDLDSVEALLSRPLQPERWMRHVADMVADQRPTICFSRHRATATAIARYLGDSSAWVTGSAAGIGPHRMARDHVLAAFGPDRARWQLLRRCPTVLVCTEVLAEGLDLQGASRVIHLDLPWHHARMEQRMGRVQRIGQLAPDVVEVMRRPAPAIERVLRMHSGVRRKARTAHHWLHALSRSVEVLPHVARATWCAVARSGEPAEAVALVSLRVGGRHGAIALVLHQGMWRQSTGAWPNVTDWYPPESITPLERARLVRLARRAVWRATALIRGDGVARPRLVARVLSLARDARRQRNAAVVERLGRTLALASRAVPLGVEVRLTNLTTASDHELLHASLPTLDEPGRAMPESIALVLFRREHTTLR